MCTCVHVCASRRVRVCVRVVRVSCRLPTSNDVEAKFCASNQSHVRGIARRYNVVLGDRDPTLDGSSGSGSGAAPLNALLGRCTIGASVTVEVRQGSFQHVAAGCALFSPSNNRMRHGAGLAAAIDIAAGPALQAECAHLLATKGPLTSGSGVLTGAHNLAAVGVAATVHVVAPVFDAAADAGAIAVAKSLLRAAVVDGLALASGGGHGAVAVCGMGCGVFGWPSAVATAEIVTAVREWEARRPRSATAMRVVLFDVKQEVVVGFVAALAAPSSATATAVPPPRVPTHQVRDGWL